MSQMLKWLKQHDPIPEMQLHNLIKLMSEGYGYFYSVQPKGKEYAVRFSDKLKTLRVGNEEFRSMLVTTQHRNGITVSPLVIAQLLVKFEITEDNFRKVYNRLFSQPPTGP
jgi:hypothetical protein